jgi:hypothetical protein
MSILADILDDNCTSLDGWTHNGEGTITVSDGFKIEVSPGGDTSLVSKVLSSLPNIFTVEIKTNFPKLGLFCRDEFGFLMLATSSWIFQASFTSDGLILFPNDLGSLITVTGAVVKHDETAEDQTWRFQINKTVEDTSTVEVFLEGMSLGSYGSGVAGAILPGPTLLLGVHMSDVASEAHFKGVKMGIGLGEFAETSTDRYWIGNIKSNPTVFGWYGINNYAPKFWFQWGNFFAVDPLPDASYSLILYEADAPSAALTGTTSVPSELPAEFQTLLVDFACYVLSLKLKKWKQAARYYNKYINDLNKKRRDFLLSKEVDEKKRRVLPDQVVYSDGRPWQH